MGDVLQFILRCKKARAERILQEATHILERTHMYLDDVLSQFLTKFTKGSRMSEKEVQLKFLSNIIQRQDVAFVTGITRRSRHKKRVHYLQVGPHGGNR